VQLPTGSNEVATAALILGILGTIAFWTVRRGILLGTLAVIFGTIARSRVKTGARGRGQAVAGIALGMIGIVLSIVMY
jgi:hypothetical protein